MSSLALGDTGLRHRAPGPQRTDVAHGRSRGAQTLAHRHASVHRLFGGRKSFRVKGVGLRSAPIGNPPSLALFQCCSVTFHSVIFWGEACLRDAKSILPSWKVAQLIPACLNVSPTRAASHSYDKSSLGRSRQLLRSDSLPWSCDPDARQCFRALMHDYTMQVVGRLRHAAQPCAVIWTSLPRCGQR